MKKNLATISVNNVKSALHIEVELGHITRQQAETIKVGLDLDAIEKATERRNRKPVWERLGEDLADLLESYNVKFYAASNRTRDVVFFDEEDAGQGWGVPVDEPIDAEFVRKWPGIIKRQRDMRNKILASKSNISVKEYMDAMFEARYQRKPTELESWKED